MCEEHEVVIPASSESTARTIVSRLDEMGLKGDRMRIREATGDENE